MKRIVLTFADEAVYKKAEKDLIQELRENYASNEDDVQDSLDMEEDEEEIRIVVKKIED